MPRFLNLSQFTRGWLIGDFSPSIIRSSDFEVAIMHHKAHESTIKHYHTSSSEINILVEGEMIVNQRRISKNDIFIYERMEISDVKFLADSTLCVVRVPSSPNDKIIVENNSNFQ